MMNHGWKHLDNDGQKKFAKNCVRRRAAFEIWTRERVIAADKDILIVADRPGPKAPQTDSFHHTPFYSKIHSGGWLNAYLVDEGVQETRLMWVNSATWDGKPGDTEIFRVKPWNFIIALGKNAQKFVQKNAVPGSQRFNFDHPQYHKRFVGSHGYQFVDTLVALTQSEDERID